MGISKLLNFVMIMLLFGVPKLAAGSPNINNIFDNKYGYKQIFSDDTVIHSGVNVVVNHMDITDGITIDNRGYIDGNINVCPNCHVFLRNSGTIDATINLGSGAHITQIIGNPDEITDIGIYDDFDILICDGMDVSFDTLMMIGQNATRITLDNVVLRMDGPPVLLRRRMIPDIELRGEVSVILGPLEEVLNGNAVLNNISGDGTLNFYSDELDPIHALTGRVENGNVYVELVRETDYMKIFKNATGKFLNDLRAAYPDDSLLVAMDSVSDMNLMYDIMTRSLRLHPINLMRPIREHMAMRDIDLRGRNLGTMDSGARVMWSSDYYMYGIDASIGFNVTDNWSISALAGMGYMEYGDDINIYSGNLYDALLEIGYDNGRVTHRTDISLSVAKFDTGPVMSHDDVYYNPTGFILRAIYEIGMRFSFLDRIKITPTISITGDMAHIAGINDYRIDGTIGSDIAISGGYFILDYDYFLRVRANTSMDIAATLGVLIHSPADNIGTEFSLSTMHNEFGNSFKALARLYIKF